MTSKFLFAATATLNLSLSLLGTLALADHAGAASLTREQVAAEAMKARADGTLQRTDYDADARTFANARSTLTRSQVVDAMAAAKAGRAGLFGPDRNGSYNPFGTQILNRSTMSRETVKSEANEAVATGVLPRSDYDVDDEALMSRRVAQHLATGRAGGKRS